MHFSLDFVDKFVKSEIQNLDKITKIFQISRKNEKTVDCLGGLVYNKGGEIM